MNEFSLIEKYFLKLAEGRAEARSFADDAAVLCIPPGRELVVTSDALVADTHFLPGEKPEFIARKALRVNLSDLAAMGAEPLSYQLCLTLPGKPDARWISAFCAGLKSDQKRFGIFCSGGDTTSAKTALTIGITALGTVPRGRAVPRNGARPGDALVITGPVGNALAGLRMLQGKIRAQDRHCIAAHRLPEPRVKAAAVLRKYAVAAIDISDGLAADAGHVCEASGCAVEIDTDGMEFSAPVRKHLSIAEAITGGDDYELALAVRPRNLDALLAGLRRAELRPQVAGRFVRPDAGTRRPRVRVYEKGRALRLSRQGWTHF